MTRKKKGLWMVEFSDGAVIKMEQGWIENSGYELWVSALGKAKAARAMARSQKKKEKQTMDTSEESAEVLRLQQQLQTERGKRQKEEAELERGLKEATGSEATGAAAE